MTQLNVVAFVFMFCALFCNKICEVHYIDNLVFLYIADNSY